MLKFSGKNPEDGSRYFARNLGFSPPNYTVSHIRKIILLSEILQMREAHQLFHNILGPRLDKIYTSPALETGRQNPVSASAWLDATHKEYQCVRLFMQSTT